MTLTHFSPESNFILDNRFSDQPTNSTYAFIKPVGLWLSDETPGVYGWSDWCRDEEYSWVGDGEPSEGSRTDFKVDLSRVLVLATADSVRNLPEMYPGDERPEGSHEVVDWSLVAQSWAGILVTPYQWSERMLHWYYPWDCASACIWDLSVLQPKPAKGV